MNFKKLSKEKRNQLILVVLGTMVIMAGLGFGLISFQYSNLKQMTSRKVAAGKKLHEMQDSIRNADRLETELVEVRKKLEDMESDMATGDRYSWVINTIKRFKLPYKVEIPQFSPISADSDVTLLPKFPYKQASLTVAGTAHYHELGRFLADFENEFPHIRILNLTLDANPGATSATADDAELLGFKMEIVTLVKPTQS